MQVELSKSSFLGTKCRVARKQCATPQPKSAQIIKLGIDSSICVPLKIMTVMASSMPVFVKRNCKHFQNRVSFLIPGDMFLGDRNARLGDDPLVCYLYSRKDGMYSLAPGTPSSRPCWFSEKAWVTNWYLSVYQVNFREKEKPSPAAKKRL